MKHRLLLFSMVLCSAMSLRAQSVALFYLSTAPDSVRSFEAHSDQIDLLVPTWYAVDADGLVTGAPNPAVLERAHKEHLPVQPLIALFNKKDFHTLASNSAAQDVMNQAIVRECRLHGYNGFQIDFENIAWTDRDLLSALVARTADALHRNGLLLSIATVPNAPGYPGSGGFAKWIYTDWRGGYDLAAIAKSVDLICLMTYDQHTRWTEPGPVAGWEWTTDNLNYALKQVPAAKLSLGIPLYGYHWFTGAPTKDEKGNEQPNPKAEYIGAPNAMQLAATYNTKIQWDAEDHAAYFFFYRDQMREWIFLTDLHTFQDRYDLVKQDHLQGFCSWVLGEEDPAIWKLLPKRK